MIVAVDLFRDIFTEVESRVFSISLIVVVAMSKVKIEFAVLGFPVAIAWGVIMAFMQILFQLMAKVQILTKALVTLFSVVVDMPMVKLNFVLLALDFTVSTWQEVIKAFIATQVLW